MWRTNVQGLECVLRGYTEDRVIGELDSYLKENNLELLKEWDQQSCPHLELEWTWWVENTFSMMQPIL